MFRGNDYGKVGKKHFVLDTELILEDPLSAEHFYGSVIPSFLVDNEECILESHVYPDCDDHILSLYVGSDDRKELEKIMDMIKSYVAMNSPYDYADRLKGMRYTLLWKTYN